MDSLNQLINDVNSYESEVNIVIKYEDIKDTEYLRELFIDLDLDKVVICVDDNKISQYKDTYGFYYASQNQSTRLFNIMPSEEGENFWLGLHYKYHAEKFKDDWWYYELKYTKS